MFIYLRFLKYFEICAEILYEKILARNICFSQIFRTNLNWVNQLIRKIALSVRKQLQSYESKGERWPLQFLEL